MTNKTMGTFLSSERAFDANTGLPLNWKIETTMHGAIGYAFNGRMVRFSRASFEPITNAEKIFAPVFPPEYSASEVSGGKVVVLRDPQHELINKTKKTQSKPVTTTKPSTVVVFLAAFSFMTIIVVWFIARKR